MGRSADGARHAAIKSAGGPLGVPALRSATVQFALARIVGVPVWHLRLTVSSRSMVSRVRLEAACARPPHPQMQWHTFNARAHSSATQPPTHAHYRRHTAASRRTAHALDSTRLAITSVRARFQSFTGYYYYYAYKTHVVLLGQWLRPRGHFHCLTSSSRNSSHRASLASRVRPAHLSKMAITINKFPRKTSTQKSAGR